MSASRQPQQPSFFWQGLLIVLPVAVLAAVGLFSLRQDKILAQHDAAERAQAIANEMVQNVWTELTEVKDPTLPSFKIDPTGQLLSPAPYSPWPVPEPLPVSDLNPRQAQLWQQ